MKEKLKKIDINKIQDTLFSTKGILIGGGLVFLLFAGSLVFQAFAPKQANILYALCSTFLELNVTFPQNIRETDIELYRKSVRIYYTQMDSFGQERMEATECSFYQDPQKGIQIDQILFDSVKDITTSEIMSGTGRFYPVKPEIIDHFNKSGSATAIMNSGLDITVPEGARVRRY